MLSDFYKDKPENTIWRVDEIGKVGRHLFSFDKKKIYNLWVDYPHNFTPEEKEIFDREYPYWAAFFDENLNADDFLHDDDTNWEDEMDAETLKSLNKLFGE